MAREPELHRTRILPDDRRAKIVRAVGGRRRQRACDPPRHENMSTPCHMEIIGGGLAGLLLGAALHRAVVPTAVYEAGDYPRHRVCGEFITGLDASTIDRLGLADVLRGGLRHE